MAETILIEQAELDARIGAINEVFERIGIERDELAQLDHVAYRTRTLEEYYKVVEIGSTYGKNLGEVMVAGRPISVIELDKPFESGGWIINFLEIAAPKATSLYPSGLEHAEFVTNGLLQTFEARHAELNFVRDAMHRKVNPELKFREQGISVKFHQLNIGAVVRIEEALGVTQQDE